MGCDEGGMPPVDCDDAVDAGRIVTLNVLGKARRVAETRLCGRWALLDRVHVEKDAGAVERGAIIAGGWRFANALAGHIALRESIAQW